MSCCDNNYGWGGGCGCNTVQYAPPACNPNFPTACTPLGQANIVRVVGEDSNSCKYTIPTLSSNSILFYNPSTALASWADGTTANPIFIGSGSNQATATSSVNLQATTPTGQLVAFQPPATTPYTTEVSFPIVSAGGSTASWGTIESIVPNQGLVYRNNSGSVAQLSSSPGNIVTFDALGNPIAQSASTIAGITAVPSGAILPFAYNVTSGTVPTGWLLCDGSIYTVAAYPTLGALLANTYGGSTGTFAVPNLSGLFIRGSGTQTSSGITYASGTIGTIQADEFQGHEHNYSGTTTVNSYGAGSGAGLVNLARVTTSEITDGTNGTPRYGSETRPVNLAMVYCIKT